MGDAIVKKAALFVTIAALAACSGIRVTSDWDPAVDFSQFQTFAILDEGQQARNPLNDRRIRAAIAADLSAKGFRQVDTLDKADLAIGFQITTDERTSYQTVHHGWSSAGFHRRRSHWGGSVGISTTTQWNYTVGTLVIAVFEARDKELVWEASGSRTKNPSSSPEQSEQRINEAVREIMQDFPPGS